MTEPSNGTHQPQRGRLALLIKAARMYHEEGIRQPEIAERLNLSQSRVSRLLKDAQRLGVVRTTVVTPPGFFSELEQAIAAELGLRDVVVSEAASDDDAGVLSAIGAAAASYFESTLASGERVGISSRSASLLAMVESLAPIVAGSAEVVVQTLGAVGNPTMRAQATRLTDRLAQLTGADPIYLAAPGVVANRDVRDGLLADPYIADAAAAWRTLSVVLTGIGAATPLRTSWGAALPQADIDRLSSMHAVGDVCLNFFDGNGAPVDGDLRNRVIGIGADDLLAVPRRIGVAGGAPKVDAIRAAARGGWINILVTDNYTARRLLA
ncbi:sugar-binding transcriptional regulator [Microlunatus elymi]|nr:sugar-binding domain-containing protein [Microlunatus elymi]